MDSLRELERELVAIEPHEEISVELQNYRTILATKMSLASVLTQTVELNFKHINSMMHANWLEVFSIRKDAKKVASELLGYIQRHYANECMIPNSHPQLFLKWISALDGCHAVNSRIDRAKNTLPGDAWLTGESEAIRILDMTLSRGSTPQDMFLAMIVLAISASLGSYQALLLTGECYYASCYLKHDGVLSDKQKVLPAFKVASVTLGHWGWGTQYFKTAQKCMSASRYLAVALGNSFTDLKRNALICQQGLGNILGVLQYFYLQFKKLPGGFFYSTNKYLYDLEVLGCEVSAVVVAKLQSQTELRVNLIEAVTEFMSKAEGDIYLFDLTYIASAVMKLQSDTNAVDAEELSQAIQAELNKLPTDQLIALNTRLNGDRVYRLASSAGPISFSLATLSSASDLCLFDRGKKSLEDQSQTLQNTLERHCDHKELLPRKTLVTLSILQSFSPRLMKKVLIQAIVRHNDY